MGRTLSEHDSKELVASFGVHIVPDRVAETPDEAARSARDLGFPVALKLTGANIAHKTERGLVRLGLDTAEEVEAAATELLAAADNEDGQVALLVAPMVRGTRELIAGLHNDDQFGPCVMVGIGGVLAEAIADVAYRLVPIDDADANDMIDELRSRALFGALRGEPAVDRAAVVKVLRGLSALAEAHPDVAAVDLNPLVVTDGVPVAVDALVELIEPPT